MNFEQALQLAGLRPRDVPADGRIHRCPTKTHPKKRNGWFILFPDGRRGVWGDNAQAPRQALGTWTAEGYEQHTPTAAERERQKRIRERARADRIAAIRRARDYWNAARPCSRLHPYLAAKGLSPVGTIGLREHDGLLVVPVMWRGRVLSFQSIHQDGTKRFAAGAPVKGGCWVIERPRAAITCIVEGLATGLAVFQCVRTARVIVAFDAGNLAPASQAMKPHGSVVFCADNDIGTQEKRGFNPGIEKARAAAEVIGAGVSYPQGIGGTDWADALREWGEPGAKRIERLIQAGVRYVVREDSS